jgi:CRP-like cAMP-binding protein
MEKLRTALGFSGILSGESIDYVITHYRKRSLKVGDHFHELHKIAREIAFVEQGVLRVYAIDPEGNEVVKYFVREKQFGVDLDSYYSAIPGKDAIQAVVDSEIYTISKTTIDRLCEEVPNLYLFLKSITEVQLLNKIKDNDFLNYGNSKTKYLEFLKRYPELVRQVPLQDIASYLKITPQSLSRIRRELM